MNSAIIFIKGEKDLLLAKKQVLGKTLLEHTITSLKDAEIEKIYLLGADDIETDIKKVKDINEIIAELKPEDKCILTTSSYPFLKKEDYQKLFDAKKDGAIAVGNNQHNEIYMLSVKDLNNFDKVEYEFVEINPQRLMKIDDKQLEVLDVVDNLSINNIGKLDIKNVDIFDDIKIFSLPSCENLVDEICSYLGIKKASIDVEHFADGETLIQIGESVRGKRVFLVQSTCAPVNERLMELLIAINCLKLSSATSIGVIMPYFGYARQDRKAKPRQPITAKLVADLLETAGAIRVITFDLHAAQIEGFFNFPVDNISVIPMMADYYLNKGLNSEDVVVVSPDHGGVNRCRRFAEIIKAPIAIIDKRRPRPNEVEVSNVIGAVEGKDCIIVDDICDTGKSLVAAANILKEYGAKDIYVCLAHGVFSGNAVELIEGSHIKEVVVTNSIPLTQKNKDKSTKIVCLSVAKMLAEIIKAITLHGPISPVYDMFKRNN